ncbi:hypothetical protein DQ04_05331040 [Trypanosoma grayi]|uniref:hypothetical protein n=1 Tax=Trypanosoma grayi TaxID=71804 RepID=UPI0004F44542|nr:hypothetical protein DQ04_05331040 [Trypanosoma grayi]KEG09374.1 hypothetical protein DQ04_05331040 [Trypanosoma grayi]
MEHPDGNPQQQDTIDALLQSANKEARQVPSLASVVAPVQAFPVDEPGTSPVSGRKQRNASVSLQRQTGNFEMTLSQRSVCSPRAGSRRSSLRTVGQAPEGLDRAVSMVQTYPLMMVDGTAFGNHLSRRGTGESVDLPTPMRSARSPTPAEGEVLTDSSTDLLGALGRLRPSESVVSLASRCKRACMWETIIVNFLAHRVWYESFRRLRLRTVLETHLLPVILRKRGEAVVGGRFVRKPSSQAPVLLRDDEGQKPQGSFLIEQCPFFAALESPKFCDSIAEVVLRYRFSLGEAIVNVGSPSQEALHILISGRCDAILPASEGRKGVQRRRLQPGETFGGLMGGKAVFSEVYRAISRCIIWVIRRESFETLFQQYADERMKNVYLRALKQQMEERLHSLYPMPQSMSRVPIYRNINGAIEQYANDFTPLVLTKGEVLFNQGDSPGAIYCLVEGQVQRDQLGPDMTYESGTQQILSPNESDNSFALATRFILLGEEPHILPGVLRYRCTVASRAALFYKIEGGRFVNALLDDARLFLEIREKLTTQIRLWMRLAPEALLSVPILRELPQTHFASIVHAAEARVVERSVSLCEPAQNIREIYLLVAGGVRDPRQFNHAPTQPVSPPSTESDKSQEKAPVKGKKEKLPKTSLAWREKEMKNSAFPSVVDGMANARAPPSLEAAAAAAAAALAPAGGLHKRWSFFRGPDSDSTKTPTYPDEQVEITPPLPPNPAKNIVCTIGGGWEGLLLEKWPNGWETTNTVELWAVPMLTIRTEFNSSPKSTQNSILSYIRNLQMQDLSLPAPVVAKLPPMSVYLPPDKRLTKHSLGLEKGLVHEKSAVRRSGKTVLSGVSREVSNAVSSKPGRVVGEFSFSHSSTLTECSVSTCDGIKSHKKKQPPKELPKPPRSSVSPTSIVTRKNGKKQDTCKLTKTNTITGGGDTAVEEVRKPKAGPPPLLFLRRLAAKPPEEPPVITPELCAIYAGREPQKGIIRQPPQVLGGAREKAVVSTARCVDQQSTWPSATGAKKQWFGVVPEYAPLPGTINNQNYIVGPPSLVPNTALMLRREKKHGEVLAAQAAYFLSLAHSRRNGAEAGDSTLTQVGGNVNSLASPRRCNTPKGVRLPAPGRHAYRL